VSLALALGGCTTPNFLKPHASIVGWIPDPAPNAGASAEFRAGASRVDLTPIPGIAMNYSMDGKVSRGFWTRLFARAIYLEAPGGDAVVFVSADLPHIPNGLVDRVAELVSKHPEIAHLAREQIVLAATHTHNGPENFFSDAFYNGFPSPRSGFDPNLFDFLAARIVASIREAHAGRAHASLDYREAVLDEFFRNRSMGAFRLNADAKSFIALDGKDTSISTACNKVEGQTDPGICHAVWPKLEIVELKRASGPDAGARIASAVFLAAHPTVLGKDTQVFQGDVFGAAARIVEQKRSAKCGDYDVPVLAVFNGAQGDASIAWREGRRDRHALLNENTGGGEPLGFAVRLARAICGESGAGLVPNSEFAESRAVTDVEFEFEWLPLADRSSDPAEPSCNPWHEGCTTHRPIPGVASMGGAQDARTLWFEIGAKEGLRSSSSGDHGRKAIGLDVGGDPIRIAELVADPSTAPDSIPLGVYSVGGLVFVALPGEFTTVMGHRIREAVAVAAAANGAGGNLPVRVLLIGLANGHISYVTTPEEFDAQFYEGASNLFGAATGPLIQNRVEGLAGKLGGDASSPTLARPYAYDPGVCRVFQPRDAGIPTFRPDDGLGNILLRLGAPQAPKNQVRDYPQLCWIDAIPNLRRVPAACERAVPYVWIEKKETSPGTQCNGMFTGAFGTSHMERPCDAVERTPCGLEDPRYCAAGAVPQDNCGLDVVTALHGAYEDRTRWCAWWMPPGGEDPADYAICVAGITGENIVRKGAVVPGQSTDNDLAQPLDRFVDRDSNAITRLIAAHAECSDCPTRDVCEWPLD
jgi:neutral ceramidase